MSDRPTPETDAVAAYEGNWDTKALRMTAHARRLERERDEAREVLQEIANASHFDNIGNWARNKARQVLEELK